MNKEQIELKLKINDVTETEGGGLAWVGYLSTFDNVDSYGDVVVKGAFADDIGNTIPAFFEHRRQVGKMRILGEDDLGLKIVGELLPDEIQDQAVGKLSAKLRWFMTNSETTGALNYKMSIGYYTVKASYETRAGQDIRLLEKVKLVEGSIVLNPANDKAVITDWKSGDTITSDSLKSMDVRQIEHALKAGTPLSSNLAKLLAGKLKEEKQAQADADSKNALDLQDILSTIKGIK